MRPTSPRIPPLPTAQFTNAQASLFGGTHGDPANELMFVRTMVNHLDLYKRFIPFVGGLVRQSTLSPRHREILTLRVLTLTGETYESDHHITMARDAGLSDVEAQAARDGGVGLPPFEQTLTRAAEELVKNYCLSDATWTALAREYSREQMIELHFTVGAYVMMSMATISFGMQGEGADGPKSWTPKD